MNDKGSNMLMGWVAAIAVAVIWGVTGVVSKPLTMEVDSMALVFFRYVTAVFGLAVILFFTMKSPTFSADLGSSLKIEKKDYFKLAFCGVVGQGVFSFFNFLSLKHIGATENGVIQGLQPFATVFFGMVFMHFRMNWKQWLAFVVSALCIYAMSVGPPNEVEGGTAFLGYVHVTCSMLSIAWTSYLRDSLAKKYGSAVSMLYQYVAVSIVGLFVVLLMGVDLSQIRIILASPLFIALLIFLGTGISGLSYVIQLYSFKNIGVEKSTMVLNLVPLVSYIVAVVTLGEHLTLATSVTIVILVCALYAFNKFDQGAPTETAKLEPKAAPLA